MSIITRIKQQNDKNRVNIYLDGKFGFGIDLESFVKLNLRVEQELSTSEIEKIKAGADFQKTFAKLLSFATYRSRSEKEINDWLKRKKIKTSFHKKLFIKLKRLELIDDEKFAKTWIENRLQFKSKSKKELVFELRKKGIDRDIIENIFSQTYIDEKKVARELLKKKTYIWRNLSDKDRKRKMTEYLARKGFDWEIIRSVV